MNENEQAELTHLISPDDFNAMVMLTVKVLKAKGKINLAYKDGVLSYTTQSDGKDYKVNFLNVVKHALTEDKADWEKTLDEYFERAHAGEELEEEILEDYLKAKEYLTLRLQPFSMYEEEPEKKLLANLIYKTDLPETYSVLALDLPTRFAILQRAEVEKWQIEDAELFVLAHANLQSKIEGIEATKYNWDGAECYTLFDRDFSAAYCIDFENNCSNLIGPLGSLVGVPCRGSVFIHPISAIETFNTGYNKLAEMTSKFFDEEVGPISRNIYWFYQGKFVAFEKTLNDGNLIYTIPNDLENLLRE